MTIKLTHKMRQLQRVFDTAPEYKGRGLSVKTLSNEECLLLAKQGGYTWVTDEQEWRYSEITASRAMLATFHDNAVLGNDADYISIRIMGEREALEGIAAEIGEAFDLLGYDVLSISPVKDNMNGETWARIYIKAKGR